ncbi:TPA: BppU family phage baseplate upper protein [Bacillus cereus]|nr:BppU family phage baseplate upper protein [Bacillus cereus]
MKTKLILDVHKAQYAQLNSMVMGRVGDKASNTVDVYVVDGFVPYNLTGSDVYFECAKPDNTSVRDKNGIVMIDAAKGHFEYTFPAQTFAAIGKSKQAYFTVEKNSTVKATTQDFIIVSIPDALTNRIPSQTYISQLEELIWQLEQIELDLLNSAAYREAHDAKTFAEQAKSISESVKAQLDQIVIQGSIDPETKQARVDETGFAFPLLKDRIDALANKFNTLDTEVKNSRKDNKNKTHATLKEHLDAMHNEIDMLYANKIFVENFPNIVPESDDTPRIRRAITALNSLGGGELLFAGKEYIVSSEIGLPSNIAVSGVKGKTILNGKTMRVSTTTDWAYIFTVFGTTLKNIQFSGNLSEGDTSATMIGDFTGIKENMILSVASDQPYMDGSTLGIRRGEIQKIVGVDDANKKITFGEGLMFSYTNNPNLKAYINIPASNVSIKNIEFILGGKNTGHGAINVSNAMNVKISGIKTDGAENIGVSLLNTYGFSVTDSTFMNSTSPSFLGWNSGYGVLAGNSACYGNIENNTFSNCRHGVSGGGIPPHHVDIKDNLLTNCRIGYALDAHEPCYHWNFINNTVVGCMGGITIRGQFCTARHNKMNNISGVGILVESDSPAPFRKGIIIENNYIKKTGSYAIFCDGSKAPFKELTVKGNTCITTDKVFIRNGDNLTIEGNSIDQEFNPSDSRISLDISTFNNVTINSNKILGIGTYGIQMNTINGVTISDNLFKRGDADVSTANDGIRATGCNNIIITNNNFDRLKRFAVYTSTSDNIVYTQNLENVGNTSKRSFELATNVIINDNINDMPNWINLSTSFGTIPDRPFRYKKAYNSVTITGSVTSATNGTVFATLPAGFRPIQDMVFVVMDASGSKAVELTIRSNGGMVLQQLTTNATVHISATFNI